ncbi:MAG TPA: PhnD/SsuA/transferrin family substrate-binding protein [Thermodesulfovibrionales bacterium]|nr:PhnD/SsuA/transferrin family substrate-binding protein [Thermodesulfovibrionales bacterium]
MTISLKRHSSTLKFFCPLFAVILILLPDTAWVKMPDKPRLNIGYSSKTFLDVDMKDAVAALDVWVDEWSAKEGFSAQNRIYDDLDVLAKDFQQGNLDLGIVKSLDYLKIRNAITPELAMTHVKGGKKTIRYHLLVQSDSGITSIKDLRNRKLTVRKGDDMGLLFLNTLLLKNRLPETEKFFFLSDPKPRSSQVMLSVFFGQADACLTTDITYKTMVELNPQVKEKLKIIASSEEYVEGVNFFRKDYDDNYKKIVLDRSQRLKDSVRGRQIMLLFKIDKVAVLEEKDLDTVRKLLADYERLRRRN